VRNIIARGYRFLPLSRLERGFMGYFLASGGNFYGLLCGEWW